MAADEKICGMEPVNHALEVDRFLGGAEQVVAIRVGHAALIDVRGVRIVASRAKLGVARAVTAVNCQVQMAVIAFVDIDDLAAFFRSGVRDRERKAVGGHSNARRHGIDQHTRAPLERCNT